ncbi:MAG: hypothetical protein ACW99U_16195 [Candidatus Thorarchaeota archaeon]
MDDVSRSEMESAMKEATDYWDFATILGEKVCRTESPPTLVFFALLHAKQLDHSHVAEKIQNIYSDVPLVKPLFFSWTETYVNIVDATNKAIDSNPNPAVKFFLLYLLVARTDYGSLEEAKLQQKIEDILEQHKLLRPHSAYYYRSFGHRLTREGNPQSAFEFYERALELSREADDQWHQVVMLRLMAEVAGQWTTGLDSYTRARDYLREAKTISEALSDRSNLAMILQNTSVSAASRGEVSESIDCALEAVRINESIGAEEYGDAYNLSAYYASAGEGQNSLEWAKIALENWGKSTYILSYSHIAMARAFVVLDRSVEAQQHLDIAKELILKTGNELALGKWYHTYGQLERILGDYETAMDSFQRALDINERANRHIRVRAVLLDMVATEIDTYIPTKENRNDENSGPWMARMVRIVAKSDLPGHFASLMLMKAELRMKQGRRDTAFQILDAVIATTDNAATRYQHEEAVKTRETWILEGISVPEKRGTDTS